MAVTISGSTPTFSVATGYAGGTVTNSTSVSASGTSVSFTNLPSWVKRITVMINGTGTSTGSNQVIRFGSSNTSQTTGYNTTTTTTSGGGVTAVTNTTGFHLGTSGNTSSNRFYGSLTLTFVSSNNWVATATMAIPNAAQLFCSGQVAMTGSLNSVFITSANGTDTFNAGTINILYE
jgi:hypothetical protein